MSYFVETVLNAVMAYILQLIKVKENITEKKQWLGLSNAAALFWSLIDDLNSGRVFKNDIILFFSPTPSTSDSFGHTFRNFDIDGTYQKPFTRIENGSSFKMYGSQDSADNIISTRVDHYALGFLWL